MFVQVLDSQWEVDVKEYAAINITGFRLVDTSNPFVQNFLRKWRTLDPKKIIFREHNKLFLACNCTENPFKYSYIRLIAFLLA